MWAVGQGSSPCSLPAQGPGRSSGWTNQKLCIRRWTLWGTVQVFKKKQGLWGFSNPYSSPCVTNHIILKWYNLFKCLKIHLSRWFITSRWLGWTEEKLFSEMRPHWLFFTWSSHLEKNYLHVHAIQHFNL